MKTLKIRKNEFSAELHISTTGIRVFIMLNGRVTEKCYQTVEECYSDVACIIDTACCKEETTLTQLSNLFNSTDGYTVVHTDEKMNIVFKRIVTQNSTILLLP